MRDIHPVAKVIGLVFILRIVGVAIRVGVVSKGWVGRIPSGKIDPEGELSVTPFPNRDSVFPSRFEWLEPRKERD